MRTLWKNLGRERCLLTDFILFFHSWRSSVFPCISDSRCVIRDVLLVPSSCESRPNHEDLSTNLWVSDLLPSQRRWYALICIDMRCVAGTCYQNLSCKKAWDAGDARWIRRCSGGRAWRCARGKPLHTVLSLLISLWSHVDVVSTRWHHLNYRKTSKSPVKRYGIWMSPWHHVYTFNTHWHTMTWLTCPDGMKQLETVLPVAPVAERAWNFTVSIFKSSTCRLGGDVGRKSRRGDGVRSTGPGLIDFKILHTNLIGYFSMKFACDSETNSIRKFELHNRVWYG